MEVRVTNENEYSVKVEIGIIRPFFSVILFPYFCSYLFREKEHLKILTTYLVRGDFVGEYIFRRAGFIKSVIWRNYVKISEKKHDIMVYTRDRDS